MGLGGLRATSRSFSGFVGIKHFRVYTEPGHIVNESHAMAAGRLTLTKSVVWGRNPTHVDYLSESAKSVTWCEPLTALGRWYWTSADHVWPALSNSNFDV